MINFRKLFTTNAELRRVQDEVDLSFKQIDRLPWMGGVILSNISLSGASADTSISHGLGHAATGFLVIAKNNTADIWTSAAVNATPELTLIVKSSAAVTVTVWIF